MEILDIIQSNREKYLRFNEIKYKRFQELIINVNIRRVINSIPYLLCVNHKKLPGYVEGEVPLGIANYVPDEDVKKFIKGKFPATRIEFYEGPPFVEMLAVMGSVGTIAYNKKSDFDYWVCINSKDVKSELLENFRKKIDIIHKWASAEIDLSVHLFINDIELVRRNIFAEDEDEAFGATIGAILKDEFLRSSIIICGKIPFWWVVPGQVNDNEYNKIISQVPEDVFREQFVDLGNLREISQEDFLGAALFQIIKSLGNPFKSIIKMGVLEKYLTVSTDSPLLSQKVKTNVLKENFDNTTIDGYLMMFKEVYDYYQAKKEDEELLEILKKNLYLKTDPQLSKYTGIKDKKNIPPKVEAMFRYVKEWGWNINKIIEMDNFDNWDFNQVMAFWDLVRKFMLLCYQRISQKLPNLSSAKKIPESDIILLSRKIKTHFRKEKDKIEQFITFKDTPSEAVLYLEPVSQGIRDLEWRLYKRNTSEKESFKTTTLKIEKNLINIVIWASLNRIYDPVVSRFNLQSGYTRINQPQVINLMNQISEFFKHESIKIRNDYFLNPPFNFLNFIIINFDTENAEEIKNLYYLYHTSWGESFLKEYKSEADISEILFIILRDGLRLKKSYEEFCAINTPDQYKKPYKPIISNFKEAYSAIVESREDKSARYIMRVADRFVMYTRHGKTVEKEEFQNIFNLLATITLKPKRSFVYSFSTSEPVFSVLNAVYDFSKKYSITVAYEEKGNILIIYVVNEMGNLFTFFKPAKQGEEYLINMYDFCQNITKRVKGVDVFSEIDRGGICVQYFKTDRFGNITVTDDTQSIRGQCVLQQDRNNSLTLSVARHKAAEPMYNVVFPDKSSSGFIPIKNMGSLAQKITDIKKSGQLSDTVIRDLVFSDLTKEEKELGSTLYYIEKYKIESIFDKMIRK